MATLTTPQALKKLLTEERYEESFLAGGYTKKDRKRFLFRLGAGELSTDKMDEILARSGFTVAVEKQWSLPKAG